MKRPSLLIVFLSVFIDLIGFGIVMPLLPIYGQKFGAPGYLIGLIIASFSVMQFLFAPAWGRLSDRIGRRPVLLISNAGSALSYALFAIASGMEGKSGLLLLLVSRVFAGICGANLSVASAYIADVSPPEKRTRSMGLIGMAFGLGFILGPALGSFSAARFGLPGPGWVAAAICATNFCFGWFVLVESRQPTSESAAKRPKLNQWSSTLRQPTVGLLILLNFLAMFCFASFETTFGLLVGRYNYDVEHVGYLITFCGVCTALTQGVIGRLVKYFGERKLIAGSLLMLAVSMLMLPYLHGLGGLAAMLAGLSLLAAGSGLNRPPTLGLISILTPPSEQGATLGVTQSAASLARILAPIFAASVYYIKPELPYLICALIAFGAAVLAWFKLCQPATPPPSAAPAKA